MQELPAYIQEHEIPLYNSLADQYDTLLDIVSRTRRGRKLRQEILLQPDLSIEKSTSLYENALKTLRGVVPQITEEEPEAMVYNGKIILGRHDPIQEWIRINNAGTPSEKALILFHETAHSLMNRIHGNVPQDREELRAYSIEILVGQYFGLSGINILKRIHKVIEKAGFPIKYAREQLQEDKELILYIAHNLILLLDK